MVEEREEESIYRQNERREISGTRATLSRAEISNKLTSPFKKIGVGRKGKAW